MGHSEHSEHSGHLEGFPLHFNLSNRVFLGVAGGLGGKEGLLVLTQKGRRVQEVQESCLV